MTVKSLAFYITCELGPISFLRGINPAIFSILRSLTVPSINGPKGRFSKNLPGPPEGNGLKLLLIEEFLIVHDMGQITFKLGLLLLFYFDCDFSLLAMLV
jgi:hypothetical protein